MQRIGGYGKESLQRLKHAHATVTLTTPVFFSKIINLQDPQDALSDFELEYEAAEFMITGTDTTSTTLTYLVWAVCKNPEIRVKLEKEVAKLPGEFKYSDASKLKYLPCVVRAALRLYGAAAGSHPRKLPKEGWEVNGYYLPASAVVTMQAYSAHRREATYTDALT